MRAAMPDPPQMRTPIPLCSICTTSFGTQKKKGLELGNEKCCETCIGKGKLTKMELDGSLPRRVLHFCCRF